MASKVLGTVPVSVIYVFVFYAVIIFVMAYTKFGRHVYAAGGNICAARLSGINVNRTVLMVYVLSGIFAAIGGIMLLSRLTYADPNAGSGYEMNAIASAVIGGISLSGGKGKIGKHTGGSHYSQYSDLRTPDHECCHLLPDHCHRHRHHSRGVCG